MDVFSVLRVLQYPNLFSPVNFSCNVYKKPVIRDDSALSQLGEGEGEAMVHHCNPVPLTSGAVVSHSAVVHQGSDISLPWGRTCLTHHNSPKCYQGYWFATIWEDILKWESMRDSSLLSYVTLVSDMGKEKKPIWSIYYVLRVLLCAFPALYIVILLRHSRVDAINLVLQMRKCSLKSIKWICSNSWRKKWWNRLQGRSVWLWSCPVSISCF